MDAEVHTKDDFDLGPNHRVERVVWVVPLPLRASTHRYKYRLALIVGGECVLRYDNEAGKGDHRHLEGREFPDEFVDVDQLFVDFWEDVYRWMSRN